MSYVHVVNPKVIPVNSGCGSLFLAGPIRNAPPYHEEAISILVRRACEEDLHLRIYCPKREEDMEALFFVDPPPKEVHKRHERQRAWELDTQEESVFTGGILAWLTAPGIIRYPEKVYGAMTQFELGYWLARCEKNKRIRLAIGTDGKYNNELHTIRYDFARCAPHVPWFDSLGDLCEQGIQWVKNWETDLSP